MDFNAEQNGSRLVDGLKMHHPSQRMALNRHKDDALWVTLLDPDLDVASNGELRGERAYRFDADGRSWFRAEVDRHDIADVLLEVIHQLFRIAPVFAVEFTPESLSSEPSDFARGNKFRTSGVTIVFQERTIAPLRSGDRADIGETLVALVDYDSSGKFRDELAEKMIWAKLTLAQKGRATGGRPPFGFRRWLVTDNNSPVRQLADGERVRLAGHHVLWLPGPKEEFDLILRILAMVEEMPANRVAKILMEEGVPAPDTNRVRHDNGIPHVVRGVWHQNTITGIARNPLLRGIVSFGRRSMGDRRRLTPQGPRFIEDDDLGSDGKPKIVQTPLDCRINAETTFAPVLDAARAEKLDAILNQRAGSQRGKPRSRDPERNPLGSRIYDIACSWPMYRAAEGDAFSYRCGLYQQSDGGRCRHNRISGPSAVAFALGVIRQHLQEPRTRQRLQERLQARLAEVCDDGALAEQINQAGVSLRAEEGKLEKIERNMAEADTPAQLSAMKKAFNETSEKVAELKRQLETLQSKTVDRSELDGRLARAMQLLDELPEIAAEAGRLGTCAKLFQAVNLRMFLSFEEVQKKKRKVNQLVGGIVTLGSAPPPIEPYAGPTSRPSLQSASEMVSEASTSEEGEQSLRNVSRGDRI